ncbi:hypothetical protein RJ639_045458 [Escallonia herrerae]|uniref:BTB/POZ and TAZ domain-containing protein 3 n=1 Tax=Escallonia herrerae TaxID=1293975 RepID=A0AA88W7H5_9ASTE|nr:hypothetical protein RJ639_045458 [Escallonia herrerae]
MASPDPDSPWPSSAVEFFGGSLDIHMEEGHSVYNIDLLDVPATHVSHRNDIPKPPPLSGKIPVKSNSVKLLGCCCIPEETKNTWDKLFREGYGADVYIITEDGAIIPAHFSVLYVASPVLGNFLQQSKSRNGMRYIKIPGVPHEAVHAFVRFLYSSWYVLSYNKDEMKNFVLHLLVLSHCYSVPSLKRVCIHVLEQGWLTMDNVIDVLQLARNCDAPRLSLICVRMVLRYFRTISSSEGWKVMKRTNPALEQELLEMVVEAETRTQERSKKIEEKRVYLQLHEAMEALVHICRDGCRTIGPRDKVLKGREVDCSFPACKGLEALVRHFSGCRVRVPGGCVHCKRMWQLLELHSLMCDEPDYCKVPLCRHFKGKMRQQSKKDGTKWRLLVNKVLAAKRALGPFSSRRSGFT